MGILQNTRNLRHYLKLYQRFSTSQKLKTDVTVKPGDRLHGYTVDKVTAVPEFYLTAVQLTHEASGAQHLHMSRDDRNNVFGVAFRTTPMDSTGVAHILEHTVLCGSQRFPVRDPFFKMLNRSLSTFMNAFTASDWTMYPFSTQNLQDYENLLAVYLDAAFMPRLNEMDFRQEGWRLENEDLQNAESPLVFKGVVYNEMKGVFSNSEHHFDQRVQNLLLPSHTYSHVSGGDPLAIPDLSWQQLRDFHASHYHPSNARFFTYGNFPLERHLELINELALSKFTRLQMDTAVPSEPRWTQPRESSTTCQPDPLAPYPEKQTTVAVSYVLADVTDSYEGFVLSLLGALLTHGEKAPFYRSLLEANIGSNFAPTHGYSGDTKDSTFSVGLKGIHPDDTEKVKTIIQETFEQVIREGFEQDRIDAMLHQIELGLKHQTAHFGLNMGVAVISIGNNDGDPIEAIRISEQTERFVQDLKDNPRFLQDKVQQYFLDNPHKLTLVMSPDADHDRLIQEQEAQRLSAMVDSLTADDKALIYKQGLELAELQAQEEDISCLPSLKVSDIEKECETVDTDHVYVDGTTVQLCEQPTNGVTYFRCLSNIADLPEELKYYVPLFSQVVSKMGAGDKDFREMSQEIELKTGGLGVGVHLVDHHTDPALFEQGILFSSHCLDRNLDSMLNLWSDIFNSVDMSDEGRLMTLIQMTAAEMASSIADRGHAFAMTHAASSLSASSKLNEIFGGMTQVNVMKNVAEMKDLTSVVQKLKEIGSHVLNRQHVRCSLNATPESMDGAVKQVESFLHQLRVPKRVKKQPSDYKSVPSFKSSQQQVQFELPFQVNYISRGVKTASYTDPDFASLRILSRLITAKYLHREIREKGGAYGGGARGDVSGLFSFYSYRDPNSSKTVAAFDGATQWAADGSFSQQDIDEAKLSVFSQVDAPEPPGRKGQRVFLHGITDEMKQQHRDQLFQVSKADLVNVTSKYLTPAVRTSSVTLLGPENSMCQQEHWTIKKQ